MTTRSVLIDEIGHALAIGSNAQRREMLTRITDLFLAGAKRYSGEHINLFDEVIAKLAASVDTESRTELSARLAAVANAPTGVMRMLAFDDDIAVARAVLRSSECLTDEDLVAIANTKGELHRAAIAGRKSLCEAVTGVLAQCGEPAVLYTLAQNTAARFSDGGYAALVRRSSGDDALAVEVGSRRDLPRQHFLQLLAGASAAARARLAATNPASSSVVDSLFSEAASGIRGKSLNVSVQYVAPAAQKARLKQEGGWQRALRLLQSAPAAAASDDIRWWPADDLAVV